MAPIRQVFERAKIGYAVRLRRRGAAFEDDAVSRSRKKSPFTGFTAALSDQPWKAKAARAFRHSAKRALDADSDSVGLPVKRWAAVNPWDSPKDGKQRVRDLRSKWLRK